MYIVQPLPGSGYEYSIEAGGPNHLVNLWNVFFPNPGVNGFNIALEPTDGKPIVYEDEGPATVIRGELPLQHGYIVVVHDRDGYQVPVGRFCQAKTADQGRFPLTCWPIFPITDAFGHSLPSACTS